MPSIAVKDGCYLYASDRTHDNVPEYHGMRLACTECQVALKASHTGYPHYTVYFAHIGNHSVCSTSNISREHLALQALIFKYICQLGWEAHLEYVEYAGKWRGDVVAKSRNLSRMIIFEIQKSDISERLVVERTKKHKASKADATIWVCLKEFSWMDKVASCLVDTTDWNERDELQTCFKMLPRGEVVNGESYALYTRQLYEFVAAVLNDVIVSKYETEVAKFLYGQWQIWRFGGYLFQSKACAEERRNEKHIKSIRKKNEQRKIKAIVYGDSQSYEVQRFKDVSAVIDLCQQHLPGIEFRRGTETTAFGDIADYKGKTVLISPRYENFINFSPDILRNDSTVIIYRHESQRADAVDMSLDWRRVYSIHELTCKGRLALLFGVI